jgi:hypothetical protein
MRDRNFAAYLGGLAVVAVIAAGLMVPRTGALHAMGLAALAYGLGIGVAAVFIALGRNPLLRRRG